MVQFGNNLSVLVHAQSAPRWFTMVPPPRSVNDLRWDDRQGVKGLAQKMYLYMTFSRWFTKIQGTCCSRLFKREA